MGIFKKKTNTDKGRIAIVEKEVRCDKCHGTGMREKLFGSGKVPCIFCVNGYRTIQTLGER